MRCSGEPLGCTLMHSSRPAWRSRWTRALSGAVQPRRAHQRLAPHLAEEVAHEIGHRQRLEQRLQLLRVALLQAQVGFLLGQHRGGVALCFQLAACLLDDEGLEHRELLLVGLDLVEVAFDDLLHQLAHQGDEALALLGVEVLEAAAQRGDAVDETAHRVLARREEARVAERGAQHRQLQPRDLARHLRRHLRVGQDLVEQAADDVDHHVIERAVAGLAQLVAVVADQVRRHGQGTARLGREVAVARGGRAAVGGEAGVLDARRRCR